MSMRITAYIIILATAVVLALWIEGKYVKSLEYKQCLTLCDGQAIANSIWGTPIDNECVGEESVFRTHVYKSAR